MNLKRLKFIFIIVFSILFFGACSTKHRGKYDDFFNNQAGWIPVNTQNKDLDNKGSINEK